MPKVTSQEAEARREAWDTASLTGCRRDLPTPRSQDCEPMTDCGFTPRFTAPGYGGVKGSSCGIPAAWAAAWAPWRKHRESGRGRGGRPGTAPTAGGPALWEHGPPLTHLPATSSMCDGGRGLGFWPSWIGKAQRILDRCVLRCHAAARRECRPDLSFQHGGRFPLPHLLLSFS